MKIRLNKTWNETGKILTVAFNETDLDGNVVGIAAPPIVTDFSHMSEENNKAAWRHGLEQKVGDSAAIIRDKKSGKPASVEEKRAAILETAERIAQPDGAWNVKGTRGPVNADTLLAKLEALGFDVSKVSKKPVDVTPK